MGAAVGISQDRESGARPAARWSESTWTGDGIRREVFFFRSRGVELYGSLFAATEIVRPFGVVLCNSWGVEADRCDPLQRSIALSMARLGGAGLVFHYPGYGDSYGDLAGLGLADLSDAAADAVAEASRRCPGLAWILAGLVLGASVACLAQRQADVETLLLVQPALRPGAYFQKLAASRRPIAPGPSPRGMMEVGTDSGMAYGYPIPGRIAEDAEAADGTVASALDAFAGEGAVIRHQKPPDLAEPVPDRFQRCEAPGTWRFGSQNNPKLAKATVEWLDERTQGVTVGL
jgi:hypothetical protein